VRSSHKDAKLATRLGRVTVSCVMAVVVVVFIAAPVLAWRWLREPFPGLLLEPTLVLSPIQGREWARLRFDPPLERPGRLIAIDGQPVERYADVATVLSGYATGDMVWVSVVHPDGSLREEQVALARFPLRDVLLVFVLPYLAGLACLGVGVWVYRARGWDQTGQVFAGLCAAVALIVGGIFDLNTTHRMAVIWCAAVPFAAATAMHLAMVFPQEPRFVRRLPALRLLPYLPATILALRSAFSVYDISQPWEYINHWRNSYLFGGAGVLLMLGVFTSRLVRPSSPLIRQQSRIALMGSALAFLPAVPWLLLKALGQRVPFVAPVYALFLALFLLSIAHAILRHRLLDVDRLLSQGVAYGTLALLVIVTWSILASGLSHFFAVSASDPILLSLFVVALILLVNPLRDRMQRLVDRVFLRDIADYRQVLQDFSRGLTQTLELDALLVKIGRQLKRILHPACQWVYLYDEGSGCYVGQPIEPDRQAVSPVIMAPDGALARWLRAHQECLYLPPGVELPGELADDWEQMGTPGAAAYVPLRTRERLIGWLALCPKRSGQPYRSDDLAFLSALAERSALAVENARLFVSVRRNLAATTEMKHLMDDVFSSIASGVITIDVQDKVTFFNRAAETILGVRADEAIGGRWQQVLPPLGDNLQSLLRLVKRGDTPKIAYEVQQELPARGPVWLRMNLSPLKDSHDVTTGVTIVVDDLTERRQLEARMRRIRQTFERYVAPAVVERLLSNPESVRLGGMRQEVTSLYADIRAFTAFSEQASPEFQIEVLNRHLTLAAGAILAHEGTLDKFVGDGVMAIFNAPVAQADHTLRAVRAALAMQEAVHEHHAQADEWERLHFGIGISVGEAVVGNIGSAVVQNFTAIGDCVNFSSRLSDLAGPGRILISAEAYARIEDRVDARFVGYVQVKGHSEPDPVYEVAGLRAEEG
jgi:PAS domain S-box-containing protein